MGESQQLGREGASERLQAVAESLATLAEKPDLREQLIDAWEVGDRDRFQECLIDIPWPEELPAIEICLLVCRMVEISWGIRVVEVYRWKASGQELTDDEVKNLEGAVNPATGQSALDFLIAAGVIERSSKIEIYGGHGRKCEEICFIA